MQETKALLEYNTLTVKSRATEQMYNQSDIDGLYDIVWAKDGDRFNAVPSSSGGHLKSMFEVRDGNNNENMHGTDSAATEGSITIKDLSITDVNEFNMPIKGQISTNNMLFTYDGFEFNTDKDGKVESVTFKLIDPIGKDLAKGLVDKAFQIGDDVDSMGIPSFVLYWKRSSFLPFMLNSSDWCCPSP